MPDVKIMMIMDPRSHHTRVCVLSCARALCRWGSRGLEEKEVRSPAYRTGSGMARRALSCRLLSASSVAGLSSSSRPHWTREEKQRTFTRFRSPSTRYTTGELPGVHTGTVWHVKTVDIQHYHLVQWVSLAQEAEQVDL